MSVFLGSIIALCLLLAGGAVLTSLIFGLICGILGLIFGVIFKFITTLLKIVFANFYKIAYIAILLVLPTIVVIGISLL